MTGNATFVFDWRMFVDKWSLFISVTFNAGCVGARCQSCLLQLKTTVWIVTIATLHRTFQHFVVER
jgi:hypothetical protein